ncbi:putative sgs1 protein [Rhizophagus irregularis]|uniref:DNA 3'-5' helicase n=1 Tax=Rhizophagus irregularis TaxID=588596 RepID=A0A2N1N812_9GLOM|nr:putative sgs1 protein [Rhizophagus irregularis]PKK75486.1 putative sgs1 protein [Rhizophagus irregularis]
MLLTATCTRSEVDEICANLTIEENNFALIRGSTSHRSEIIFNVRERKEIRDQYINEVISIINENLPERVIIYCATHSSCEYLYNNLQENLTNISTDYFHGGLQDNEREKAMNNWKSNYTQIMIATSAFGMGINSNNVRVVIHVEAPMSMTSLIQEAGRAGRDGNTANHFIFYSKKDIRTNYSIIAEYRETLVIKNNFLIFR